MIRGRKDPFLCLRNHIESLLSLQVLGEILMLAGFFTFPEKKLDKLTIYSYNKANFR